jgi:hypothetical protein
LEVARNPKSRLSRVLREIWRTETRSAEEYVKVCRERDDARNERTGRDTIWRTLAGALSVACDEIEGAASGAISMDDLKAALERTVAESMRRVDKLRPRAESLQWHGEVA